MNRFFRILLAFGFFALLGLPMLHLFGVKETWTRIAGWEKQVALPEFSFAACTNRSYQTQFAEHFSKEFFLRKSFLRTSMQLHEWANFGLFHYGYGVLDGRGGVLFETPYAQFHLDRSREVKPDMYAEVLAKLRELDRQCESMGADFVFLTMPDKLQLYPELLPRWLGWFWDFSLFDTQAKMTEICERAGIRTFDVNRYLMERKGEWKEWVYPPFGTHFNAYGCGLVYEGLVDFLGRRARNRFRANRFTGVRRRQAEWSVDDDIGNLMNVWWNWRLEANPHYEPVFASTNEIMNAGSALAFGDCYREQVKCILRDAKLFDPNRIVCAQRHGKETAERLREITGDLRLVMMVYQSFNTDQLDKRIVEVENILNVLRESAVLNKNSSRRRK